MGADHIQLDMTVMANTKTKPPCIIKVDFVLRDAISVYIYEVAIRSLDFDQGPNDETNVFDQQIDRVYVHVNRM